jgi:ABC-2 type transport system ATP-binding protein
VSAIRIEDLHVVRGGTVVLPDLSCEVAGGAVTGLLGPSGSGKSTLLRSVVGVQRVAGGVVEVLGAPAGSPSLRARVGYMTQAPSVYGDLSVRENLRFFARVLGAPAAAVTKAIDDVSLTEFADRVVNRLSGGQRTRVSLAAALLGDPELLVLDEPANGLDPEGVRWLRDFLRAFASEGRTVLVSSHHLAEVAQTVERVVIVNRGRLVADAPLGELVADSSSLEDVFLELTAEPLP